VKESKNKNLSETTEIEGRKLPEDRALEALNDIAEWQEELESCEIMVEKVRASRNAAIVSAVNMGISVPQVSAVASLSRASVYYLLEQRDCSVEGCTEKIRAKGLCHKHYTKNLRSKE
jgi:hypothetical protein